MLNRFIKWIISLFVHETVEQIRESVDKPSVMTNETPIPKAFKAALDADLADKLQRKQSSNPADWSGSSGK